MTNDAKTLDPTKLMGFESVKDLGFLDFSDDAMASRVGAKVGEPVISVRSIDAPQSFSAISGAINFADDAVAARLGAKIGEPTDRTR